MKKEERIAELMAKLKCTREEAESVIESDLAIDKGAKLFELTAEQKKVAKQATNTKRGPTVYKFEQKKERKKNDTKGLIIAEIAKFLTENEEISVENLEIVNAEKLISFKIGENSFELDLKQKRKPK